MKFLNRLQILDLRESQRQTEYHSASAFGLGSADSVIDFIYVPCAVPPLFAAAFQEDTSSDEKEDDKTKSEGHRKKNRFSEHPVIPLFFPIPENLLP